MLFNWRPCLWNPTIKSLDFKYSECFIFFCASYFFTLFHNISALLISIYQAVFISLQQKPPETLWFVIVGYINKIDLTTAFSKPYPLFHLIIFLLLLLSHFISFMFLFLSAVFTYFFSSVSSTNFSSLLICSQALLVRALLEYSQSSQIYVPYGLSLAAGIFLMELMRSWSLTLMWAVNYRTAARLRGAALTFAFNKILRLRSTKDIGPGEVGDKTPEGTHLQIN